MKIRTAPFKFQAFSDKQLKILNWWMQESPVNGYDGIIADGAIRSGKTVSMSISFVIWACNSYNDESFALCGKTVGSLRRNVVIPLKRMLAGIGYSCEEKRSDNLLIISKGNVQNVFYLFGGRDERSQDLIQGITLAGVFFDEVALMPQSFVEQATGRCSVEGSKFWFNCNPGSPEHWFKKQWIDKRDEKNMLYLHFTMDDNLTLSEKIKHRYRTRWTGVFYKRYILGLWVLAEGLVYTFTESHQTAHKPSGWEYYVSIDYGTLNPFSAGLWAVNGKQAVRIQELYYSGRDTGVQKTDSEYADMVEELIQGKNVKQFIVDPSAASFIAELRKRGYTVSKANNNVMDGIRTVSEMLTDGTIKIHVDCKDTIREFGLYSWDEKSSVDAVIKENDHAMDDVRYFCMTVMRKKIQASGNPFAFGQR